MRLAPTTTLQVASLSLLAALAGCSDSPSNPGTPDSGAVADTGAADTGTAEDTGTTEDAGAPMDGGGTDGGFTVDVLPPTDGSLETCGITSEVATYVAETVTSGWAAANRSRSMMMYGCAGAASPRDCLADKPLVDDSTIGSNASVIPGAHLRLLYTVANSRSNFWTRSSADGRFVGRGVHVHDMVRDVEIAMPGAEYDPAFFPDNSGYMYQPGGRLCPMSSLTTGMPTSVAMTGADSPCSGGSIGLYEHLAASLNGEDYWATSAGTAAWDDGGHSATTTETRRNETWGARASVSLSLMANTGSGYMYIASRNVPTPYQGDAVISPSSRAMITRFVDTAQNYQGYVLHRLEASRSGSTISVTAHEMARYCTSGAKPAFSFDERWVVLHHYVGGGPDATADAQEMGLADENDPGFAEYASRGSANIYLLDLQTGRRIRVTNMQPGQYALYPHFRSDGWIYFLVRTLGTRTEHMIASDAALMLQ